MARRVKAEASPLQLEIPFHDVVALPPGFGGWGDVREHLAHRAETSLFGEFPLWLKQDEIIVIWIRWLPSIMLERYDKEPWDKVTLIDYGERFFGGSPFREISLKTCGGTQKKRGIAELTPNMGELENFVEMWRVGT